MGGVVVVVARQGAGGDAVGVAALIGCVVDGGAGAIG